MVLDTTNISWHPDPGSGARSSLAGAISGYIAWFLASWRLTYERFNSNLTATWISPYRGRALYFASIYSTLDIIILNLYHPRSWPQVVSVRPSPYDTPTSPRFPAAPRAPCPRPGSPGERRASLARFGGDRLSHTTCLTHAFFRASNAADYDDPWHDERHNINEAALDK